MKITISDRAHALIQMDLELDKLDKERELLELKIRQNAVHQAVLRQAMRNVLADGTYELGNMTMKDRFEQECG